jgi:hypothetical protein
LALGGLVVRQSQRTPQTETMELLEAIRLSAFTKPLLDLLAKAERPRLAPLEQTEPQ